MEREKVREKNNYSIMMTTTTTTILPYFNVVPAERESCGADGDRIERGGSRERERETREGERSGIANRKHERESRVRWRRDNNENKNQQLTYFY